MTEEGAKRSRPCTKGTLTIVCSGTVGIPSFLGVDACIHDGFLALVGIRKSVCDDYLYHQLCRLQESFDSSATHGGVFTNLTTSGVKEFRVPLPPTKAEQEAIAEALSDADTLIEALEQLLTKKRHLKQGAMQELLTGKTRLPGLSGEWEVKPLGDIARFFSGGTPPTAIASYYGGDIPWITSGNLNKSFVRDVEGSITKEGLESSSAKMVEADTLLIALYGATSGVTAISKIRAAINQAVLAIIPQSDSSFFLFYKLSHLKDWIINTYTQGGQPNLSGDIVKSIKLALPTIEEQTAIAAILSDMDAEIAALETKLTKTRQLKQGMMQELLTGRIRLV
ncbi:MAG: restriction endonuclease subunit S [Nitrospirales bacterium]